MRARGGRHVGRLRVVDEEDAVDGRDLLQPVRHAGERAQRLRDRLRRHPGGRAPRRPRPSRSRGCGSRAGGSPPAAGAARRVGTRRPAPAARPKPARWRPGPASGARTSAASRRGRPRSCRAGRGGPASGSAAAPMSGANADRVLGLEARHLADDRRVRVELARPAPTAACRRCPPRPPAARRRARSRRAARPWWSCRWCRSPRRSGSAAAARPAPARRAPASPRSRARGDHRRLVRHAGALDHDAARGRAARGRRCRARPRGRPAPPGGRCRRPITSPWARSMRAAATPSAPGRRPGRAPAAAAAGPCRA